MIFNKLIRSDKHSHGPTSIHNQFTSSSDASFLILLEYLKVENVPTNALIDAKIKNQQATDTL